MSEPDDELTPLPDEPETTKSKLSRSPYVSLGVAALVVSTVFATVAALASTRDDSAAPAPQSEDSYQTSTPDTYTTDPVSTSLPGTSSKKPSKKSSATTTDGTTEDETTADEGTTTGGGSTGGGGGGTTTTRPGPTTTTPAPKPPVAKVGKDCPQPGLACSFDGGGSTDPDGSIVKYEWNFGDGTTDTGETANHTYSAAGTFTVKLTVTDNKGLKSTTQTDVTVETPPATPGN